VLVGINLLREGLDIPEVALVAILDADKEGFLRTDWALIQTMGRAARNANGRVILYADHVSDAMRSAIEETNRRRRYQIRFNEEHGIQPRSIRKSIQDIAQGIERRRSKQAALTEGLSDLTDVAGLIVDLEAQMEEAARRLEFEEAARLRDEIMALKSQLREP
ncbi:MAG: excinuclease ABC subunit B, partial [Candidatus Thorarchaeota archaeon]